MSLFITVRACLAFAVGILPASASFRFFYPANRDSIPKLLSETGMYKDILAKSISEDVHSYDVNAALWTDGAIKSRYVVVPPGTSIAYNDTADAYGYPDRAMLIQNLALDTVAGSPESRILYETRFLALRKFENDENWYLFTYRWRPDQKDADLVSESGLNTTVQVWPAGLSGQPVQKKWRFPNAAQCALCHRNGFRPGRIVLGFFTAQLNRPLAAEPSVNQIDRFFDNGLLGPVSARPDPAKSPRWASYDDEAATLERRSRSYIAANCSNCHGQRGMYSGATPNVTIDFDYHDLRIRTDLIGKKLFSGFPVDSAGLLVPGRPDRSMIIYRQLVRNRKDGDFSPMKFSMPPLASYEPDTGAVEVLSRWVESLGPLPVHGSRDAGQRSIRIRDGRIHLPVSLAGSPELPTLVDIRGGNLSLRPLGNGVYRIDGVIRPGVHLLIHKGRVVQRLLL